jgi:transposase InsO family protein
VWGVDFMGPFRNSHGFEHILIMVDYVSKWVETMPCCKTSTEESIAMIKSMICPCFGTLRSLISDGGTHFTGKNFKKCLSKLGIEHRVSTAYHPQTNGQVEISNRQLKNILNKTIRKGGKYWSKKLDGALWAYRTTFKTPIGMTPYQFFTWAENAKIVGHVKNRIEPAREPGQAGRPGPIGRGGLGGGLPSVSSGTHVFDFLVWSENLREVKKWKIWFLGHSFPDYLKGRDGSSGIHPNLYPFAPKKQP